MTQLVNDFMPKVVDSGIIEHILDMWSPYRGLKNQVLAYMCIGLSERARGKGVK